MKIQDHNLEQKKKEKNTLARSQTSFGTAANIVASLGDGLNLGKSRLKNGRYLISGHVSSVGVPNSLAKAETKPKNQSINQSNKKHSSKKTRKQENKERCTQRFQSRPRIQVVSLQTTVDRRNASIHIQYSTFQSHSM